MKLFQKIKSAIPLKSYIFYLFILSFVFTGVSFSKYISTSSGNDSARVARWVVHTEPTTVLSESEAIYGANSRAYSFTVSNKDAEENISEVAISYSVVIALPDGKGDLVGKVLTVSLKDGFEVDCPLTQSGDTLIYSGGSLSCGVEDTDSYTLTFAVDPTELTDEVIFENVLVDVVAEQMD